jgi:5'(3')-deoxyribonucleotidase
MKQEIAIRKKDVQRLFKVITGIAKKIVCVDIDNTLANVNLEIEKLGFSINRYPAKIKENFWVAHDGLSILKNAQPIQETLSLVRLLERMEAEVVFATARSPELADVTEHWLIRHQLTGPVFYVHNKILVEADVYIEDSPLEIERLLDMDRIVLIPEWPYNRKVAHKNSISYKVGGITNV